jgi:restriction endonuclease Mrr
VREVDDVEQAEDDREPQRQERVEGAVDQPDEELAEQRLRKISVISGLFFLRKIPR